MQGISLSKLKSILMIESNIQAQLCFLRNTSW